MELLLMITLTGPLVLGLGALIPAFSRAIFKLAPLVALPAVLLAGIACWNVAPFDGPLRDALNPAGPGPGVAVFAHLSWPDIFLGASFALNEQNLAWLFFTALLWFAARPAAAWPVATFYLVRVVARGLADARPGVALLPQALEWRSASSSVSPTLLAWLFWAAWQNYQVGTGATHWSRHAPVPLTACPLIRSDLGAAPPPARLPVARHAGRRRHCRVRRCRRSPCADEGSRTVR